MNTTPATAASTQELHRRKTVARAARAGRRPTSGNGTGGNGTGPAPRSDLKIAYLVSRFPKLTETFVLYEMLALEQQGIEMELYPLQREQTQVINAEALPYVQRAHFQPFVSRLILLAHLYYLKHAPRAYWSTLWTMLRANWGSLRMFGGVLAFWPKVVYFARHMQEKGITHLHAHFASHPAAAAFAVHRLTGIPYSFTAHGSDLHRDQHMLVEKVAEAAFVVAISEYNKRMIVEVCGGRYADKVDVLHCGADTKVFLPRLEPTPCDRGEGPLQILCIGTLHEVKGQVYLLDACRLLKERGVDFRCHFVGDGPDRAALVKHAAQIGVADRVEFHGHLTRPDVAKRLHSADVLVTPSVPSRDGRREGIPVVLMEAMGCGLPVVASDLSGIPELVEDGVSGYLVAPRDVQGLADAVERLSADAELRQRLGRAGRTQVFRNFNLRVNAAALVERFRRKAEQPCA